MHGLESVLPERRSHPGVPPQHPLSLRPFGALKLSLKLLQRSLNELNANRDKRRLRGRHGSPQVFPKFP